MITEPPASSRPELSGPDRSLLEKRLQRARQGSRPNSRPAIAPRPQAGRIPLSHAQERLWFLNQILREPGIYNLYQGMRLTGALDQAALQRALDELVRRHEVFRSAIIEDDEGPTQVVVHPERLPLDHHDLSATPAAERDAALKSVLVAEARRPFDLEGAPLIRAQLVRLAPEEHVLLLTMHHIVSDGWTIGVLFRELAALYDAFAAGRESPLAPLPIRFADYALWERETFQGEALAKPLAYWRRQLAGASALQLLTDRPHSTEAVVRGATETRHLSADLVRELRTLSQREGATLFMTLLAGFQALLHRYTGQDDIVLGSCVAGRTQVQLESLAGFFVNTLVLRTSVAERPSFRQLLARTRETVLGAMAHQDLPFEKVVAELQPDRSPARNPFFQTMFVLQSATGAPPQSSGLRFEPIELDNGTAKFDLTLSVSEVASGLAVQAEYRTDLFEPATVARLLEHYHLLLEAAVADPARRVSELPLLSPSARAQLLNEWSTARKPYPREATVVELFQEWVRRTPDAPAVTGLAARLSYRELDEASSRLARVLQRQGAGPGAMVAFCLERSPQIAVTLLAILKTGAAYVSLDPGYPAARLGLMLADARPAVVVTQDHLQSVIESALSTSPADTARPTLLSLDAARSAIDREESTLPAAIINAESVAYVCYTSGSTGRPKGACVPHRAIVRLVRDTNYMHFGPEETFLQFAPVAFDASTLEIWGPLLNGGRLAVFPPGLPSLAELADFIQQQGVTTAFLTTGLLHQMVDEQVERLGGLRQLITGGEVLSPVHAARVLKHLPHTRLVNGYGPTENTTFTTAHHVTTAPTDGRSIPIGRPIANTTVYLLDGHLQPVPIGVPGELYTGGDGLAAGYLGRPELNAERFVPNPFDSTPGARLYRTGDLARWLPDGTIEFLGRADRQVKLRGFRVEPGEIETVLAHHPTVAQAAVILDTDSPGGPRLIGYVAPRGALHPDPAELRSHLQKSLPEYMVPAVIVPVAEIPLNANGKVDRQALPAIDATASVGRPPVVAARDEIEARLVTIWEKTLGVAPVGVHDSFFQLGGHSMTGVRLFARIEKEFGRRLPLASLFECPTLELLAARLREPARKSASSVVTLQPRGTRPAVFFIHGAGGGNLWTYTNLVAHFPSDQPVYALESRGMRGQPEFERIDEMAAHYVREIRAVQPQGPYYLAGYCFGGNVAFEMARQFSAAGDKVAMVALIDSAPANSTYQRLPWWRPEFYFRFALNTGYWLRDFAAQPFRDQVRYVRRKGSLILQRIGAMAIGRNEPLKIEEVIDVSLFPEIELTLWKTHLRALSTYQPAPYDGPVVLLRTRGHPFLCSFDPLFGWGPLARGGVETVHLPGAHEGIFMEPHVREVSARFLAKLTEAQNQNRTS